MKTLFLLLCLMMVLGMDAPKEHYPSLLNSGFSDCEGEVYASPKLLKLIKKPKKWLGLMDAQQVGGSLYIQIGFCNSCGIDSYETALQVVATDTINLIAKGSDDDGEIDVTLCRCYYTVSYEIDNFSIEDTSKILFNRMPLDSVANETSCFIEEIDIEPELDIDKLIQSIEETDSIDVD